HLPHPPPTPTLLPYTTLFRSPPLFPPSGPSFSPCPPRPPSTPDTARPPPSPPNAPCWTLPPTSPDLARGRSQTPLVALARPFLRDRKSTRLNSSHDQISYAVF